MLTVSELAKRHGLSRSTLLHYDRIDLLKPSGRSNTNYRLYSNADQDKLSKICELRNAGLSLATIAEVITQPENTLAQHLQNRLLECNQEISRLRTQQELIIKILGKPTLLAQTRSLDKARWVNILKASGMTEPDMQLWHVEYERQAPESHQDFLESLGIAKAEIKAIRKWSQSFAK